MPNPIAALAITGGASAAGAAYQGHEARKAAKSGAESSERISNEQAGVTRDIAANAEELNRERYLEAQGLLLPRVGQSDIAQRQLMAEMGLPDYYGEQNQGHRQQVEGPVRRQELQAIVDEGYGEFSQQSERDKYNSAVDELQQISGGGAEGGSRKRASLERLIADPNTRDSTRAQAQITLSELEQSEGNTVGGNVSYDNAPGGQGYAPSSAYMNAPGYQASMDESLRAVEQSAVSSGSTAYGGRRLKEAGKVGAGVQQSYYNNFMNLLQNMAQPQVAQNLASMGMNQGMQIGQQNIAAGNTASNMAIQGNNQANQYRMAGTEASNAAVGDVLGGGMNLMSGMYQGGYI